MRCATSSWSTSRRSAEQRWPAERKAEAIITGEAVGQVSSQTLTNLRAIEPASDLPVFRPLLGFDKMDIIELSRRIGTFDISSKVREYCAIAPGKPAINLSVGEPQHAIPDRTHIVWNPEAHGLILSGAGWRCLILPPLANTE